MRPSRRDMILGLSAAAAWPPAIARALSLPAGGRTGTIRDVEHVVILMQENRSFDHYFGTLRGVRGFDDPAALRLPGGDSVFHQPNPAGGAILPFHLDAHATSAAVMKSLDHSWKGSHAEWARHEVWVKHKSAMTMGHFTRADIPFYHALADAFTIGDQYFCSVHGPTNPNRLFLFSGTSGLAVGAAGEQCVHNVDDGNWTGDRARDRPHFAGWRWTTYAERLSAAGVCWKVYQEHDNYGDNALASFANFRGPDADAVLVACGRDIVAGSTAENAADGQARHLIDAVARDARAGTLPQVSWIVAPYAQCEHPEASPQAGEALVAQLIDALTADPKVWARTALILTYDENDGFFDHVPAPIPATAPSWGASTVATRGEAFGPEPNGEPVGLGVRVPLTVVSPWTRGGHVCSQVFDHTSIIRFLETRFGVVEPNITPWRRAVCGDLTTMFDFTDAGGPATLPDPRPAIADAAHRPAPALPTRPAMPRQEPGQRPARALPYTLAVVEGAPVNAGGVPLVFENRGGAGAVFQVYGARAGPWYYTVEAGKRLAALVPAVAPDGRYDLTVHGPNGFLRRLAGASGFAPRITVEARGDRLEVTLANPADAPATFRLGDRRLTLPRRGRRVEHIDIAATDHWYDVTVTAGAHLRRFAGHHETGRPSRSDPAIGRIA